MLAKKVSTNLWIIESEGLRRFFDLQYRSIAHALGHDIQTYPSQGSVLDFGAGYSRYRQWLPSTWTYTSVDRDGSAAYQHLRDLPPGSTFDRIWVIETLEHLPDPQATLQELRTYLKPDGEIWISVPFAARVHPFPQDFLRWTPEALTQLLESAGYQIKSLRPRGSDFATIISKLVYFFGRRFGINLWTLLGIGVAPLILLGLLICQFKSQTEPYESEDPLGFIVKALPLK